ncbi:MAG: nucleoside triphosphate pyrophosphohydrolase [Armatimonadetes bacterium]|nr:nucleoside triphosphate pyrophosphohydrolase [Armatimonadota bacterium]
MNRPGTEFEKLVEIIARLRGPDGCPWDREQTSESIKPNLLEETYEVLEAIDNRDPDELRSELGDLMMQAVFHARFSAERGEFDIGDSLRSINEKLIRRHPHVFGEAEVAGSDEVLHNWEEIKRAEKGNENRTSILDGVPKAMPALARAMEISKKAAKAGFEWPDLDAVVAKMEEETGELKAELAAGDRGRILEEIGDLLFTVVNVARWKGVDPEDALRVMVERFSDRFRRMERAARDAGRRIEDMSIAEMDAVWDRVKREG